MPLLATPRVVFSRPEHDSACRYGSYHILDIAIAEAKKNGVAFRDFMAEQATRDNIWSCFDTFDPALFVMVGHGNPQVTACQNNEVLFDRSVESGMKLKDRCATFLSCSWGQAAKDLVHLGMKGFHGYTEDFVFVASIFPDTYASPFMRAHLEFARVCENGKSCGEAFEACRQKWLEEIANMDSYSARFAKADYESMVFEGDAEFVPTPIEPPHPPTQKCCECGAEFDTCDDLLAHIRFDHFPPCKEYKRPGWCKVFGWIVNCPIPSEGT